MSSGNDTSKRSVDDEDDRGTKLIKTEAALVEQQPQKPDDDTMGDDLVQYLHRTVKFVKAILKCGKMMGLTFRKGCLLHGKPGLGRRVLKYLMFHCQDSVFVFPRDILDLSPIKFEDTFERAVCCDPSIILLSGLEHADGEMEEMIARKIQEISERRALVIVIGTTAMLGGVSKKIIDNFSISDLEVVSAFLDNGTGISVQGERINNLRFADDIDLLDES